MNILKISLLTLCTVPFLFNVDIQAEDVKTQDSKISVSYQFRPRFEYRDGAFRPLNKNEQPAVLTSERHRLVIDYQYKDLLTLHISPQSIGVWGQANMIQGAQFSGNQFSLFESWAGLKISDNWNMKIGRQVISLDDERFFGELDWAQGGRAHDVISFHFDKNEYQLKGFFGFNQNYNALYGNNLSNPSGNYYSTIDAFPYKAMQTLWGSIPVDKNTKVTLLATNLVLQNSANGLSGNNYLNQTLGANLFHKSDDWQYGLSGYYQMGKNAGGSDVEAFMASANADYKINSKLNIGLGSDFLSGNDMDVVSTTNKAFNPFFHTGHKFYGSMDYFGYINTGLSDNYLKLNYKNSDKLSFNLAFHQFYSPNKIVETASLLPLEIIEHNSDLGQELDLGFTYKINKFAALIGGYSFYMTTDAINYLKSTANPKDIQMWGWLQLNISPKLFEAKF